MCEHKEKGFCQKCYLREWRKKNPEKVKLHLAKQKEYYQNNKEKLKKYNKKWKKDNKKWKKEFKAKYKNLGIWKKYRGDRTSQNKRYYKKYPEKTKAHSFVARNLKDDKPKICPKCGAIDKEIYGHHPDYSKPDFVEWVCVDCHNKIHREDRL